MSLITEALHTLDKSKRKRILEAKKSEHPRLSEIKGTFSQVAAEHFEEIGKINNVNSAIDFVKSIEPEVKDKDYVQEVLMKLETSQGKTGEDIRSYLTNIILKGDKEGSIEGDFGRSGSKKKGATGKDRRSVRGRNWECLEEDYNDIIDSIEKELKNDLEMNEELRKEDDEVQEAVRKYLTGKVNEFLFDDGFDYAQVVEHYVPGYNAEWCKEEDDPDEDIAVTAAIDTIVEMLMQNLFYQR